jgi:hypothetical protein
MTRYLDSALDHDVGCAELFLESGIAAFGYRAFVMANRLGGVEFDFLSPAGIMVDQRNMNETLGMFLRAGGSSADAPGERCLLSR